MIKTAVCIKQVPAYSDGLMDPNTGLLIRKGLEMVLNPNDLSALETALRIRENYGGKVDVFSMGPKHAEEVIRQAYAMGADEGFLLTGKEFAGADVLATSYTLSQGISAVDDYDLIICGKGTTDGDTSQVSGALAEWLGIPHVNWVSGIKKLSQKTIQLCQEMEGELYTVKASYPLLIAVEREIYTPRMTNLKMKIAAKRKPVKTFRLQDLKDQKEIHYGLKGSATRVEKIFPAKENRSDTEPIRDTAGAIEELALLLKPYAAGRKAKQRVDE
ncbi:MAG: electron transfer flavoprotein subunit beta/FixA family protein [Spirochaetales bacterium]|nr:electron transfer flavoprotein subunit beta/FixA family protein [Spirochaetales bacterium]